jgi:hypothetical protein
MMNGIDHALDPTGRLSLRRRLYPLIAWPILLALLVLLILAGAIAAANYCSSRWQRLSVHRHASWKPRSAGSPVAIP